MNRGNILLKLWFYKKIRKSSNYKDFIKIFFVVFIVIIVSLITIGSNYNDINSTKKADFNYVIEAADTSLVKSIENSQYIEKSATGVFYLKDIYIENKGKSSMEVGMFAIESFEKTNKLTMLQISKENNEKSKVSIGMTYSLAEKINRHLGDDIEVQIGNMKRKYKIDVLYEPFKFPLGDKDFIIVPYLGLEFLNMEERPKDLFIKVDKSSFYKYLDSPEFRQILNPDGKKKISEDPRGKEYLINNLHSIITTKDEYLNNINNKLKNKALIAGAIISLAILAWILCREEEKEYEFMENDLCIILFSGHKKRYFFKFYLIKSLISNGTILLLSVVLSKVTFHFLFKAYLSNELLVKFCGAYVIGITFIAIATYFISYFKISRKAHYILMDGE